MISLNKSIFFVLFIRDGKTYLYLSEHLKSENIILSFSAKIFTGLYPKHSTVILSQSIFSFSKNPRFLNLLGCHFQAFSSNSSFKSLINISSDIANNLCWSFLLIKFSLIKKCSKNEYSNLFSSRLSFKNSFALSKSSFIV